MSMSTVINLAAAVGACMAAYYTALNAKVTQAALKNAIDTRDDDLRPMLDFRKSSRVEEQANGELESANAQRLDFFCSLDVKNVGKGSAVMGDNPTRDNPTQMDLDGVETKAWLSMITDNLQNTLRPDESVTLHVAAFEHTRSRDVDGETVTLAPIFYSDVLGREYSTTVTLRLSTKDVVRIVTEREANARSMQTTHI